MSSVALRMMSYVLICYTDVLRCSTDGFRCSLVGLVGLFGLLGLLGRVPKSTNMRYGVCKSDCSGGSGGPSGSCES